MANRQCIRGIDYRDGPHVEGTQSPIGAKIEWIGSQRRTASRRCRVEGISVVENLREGVHAAQSQARAEAPIQIHLQRVVRAVASGKPGPGVVERRIGFGGGRNEIRAGRNAWPSETLGERRVSGRNIAGARRGWALD